MTELLSSYGHTVGMDSSGIALTFCENRRLRYLSQGSMMNLPFRGKSFDLLTSFDALSDGSITNTKAVLCEFNRVLKDNGYLLIMDVACSFLKSGHDIFYETRERYNKRVLKTALEDTGFTILRISYANFFLFPVIFLLRTICRSFRNLRNKPRSDLKAVFPLSNIFLTNLIKI